ncbi:ABC transporter ATP-binding protein [Spirochaetota bacterium]|nr:ABC transporter ATP-binding protein [Spirochaetota bacterium]
MIEMKPLRASSRSLERFLSIKNVSKSFSLDVPFTKKLAARKHDTAANDIKALNDINLTIYEGETIALVGESGCGKSTLLKAILKLMPISGGDILYRGTSIYDLKGKALRDYRRKFQMIFQNPYASLSPRLRVKTILLEPLKLHHKNLSRAQMEARVRTMVERVGLNENWLTRYPHEFSGGQQQRIAIARALLGKPEFLAADEPVSALDVSVQAQILNLLIALRKEEAFTCLFVTHDLTIARYFSDRVTVMYLGQIVEMNTSNALFANPKHPYTQILLKAIPSFDKKVDDYIKMKNVGGIEPDSTEHPSSLSDGTQGCLFTPRCPYASKKCHTEAPVLRKITKNSTGVVACHNV